MDWGLFRKNNDRGRFPLRPKNKSRFPSKFYYFAIFTNIILRFVWLIPIFNDLIVKCDIYLKMDVILWLTIIAEALRRTVWVLIRVENEFFNNFESYRSIPNIPDLLSSIELMDR